MKSQIKDYVQWLIQHNYSLQSVKKYLKYRLWLKEKQLPLKKAQYKDLMDYIGHLQDQQKIKNVINESIRGIRHYYEFLELPNIAYNVVVKGIEKKTQLFLISHPLKKHYYNLLGIDFTDN